MPLKSAFYVFNIFVSLYDRSYTLPDVFSFSALSSLSHNPHGVASTGVLSIPISIFPERLLH